MTNGSFVGALVRRYSIIHKSGGALPPEARHADLRSGPEQPAYPSSFNNLPRHIPISQSALPADSAVNLIFHANNTFGGSLSTQSNVKRENDS